MTMEILVWAAAALVFTSFFMKTMIPLRGIAIASNVAFIGYAALGVHEGIFLKVLPILVVHVALLPLDEPAADVYVIESGSILLPEVGKVLGPGALFGEVAIFSRDAVRTATATCKTDCELMRISGARILELFYQDRQFSFKVARLLAGYA